MTFALQQQIPSACREARSVCFPCVLGLEEPRAQGKLSVFLWKRVTALPRGVFCSACRAWLQVVCGEMLLQKLALGMLLSALEMLKCF